MIVARVALPTLVALALTGCCCCGSPTPATDATVRVLAGPDPVVVKVDGKQEASMSAYSSAVVRVLPGTHDVLVEAGGRPVTTRINVKVGDDLFIGGHDASCFAIVENPADMSAPAPRWDVKKDPVPTTWSLVHTLKPGESWPEGDDLSMVSESPSTLTVSMSDRLVVPIDCAAADANAAVTAGMTSVLEKVSKF